MDEDALKLIDPKGVRIWGAKLDGDLDLTAAEVKFPLDMRHCRALAPALLNKARLNSFCLSGCRIRRLAGRLTTLSGSVELRNGFICEGRRRYGGRNYKRKFRLLRQGIRNAKGLRAES